MARLSSPIEQLKSHYQIVVVGSGYGGGITASRMARAGQEVCILERGKEFQPGDFDKDHKLTKHGEYPDTEAEALREVQIDLPKLHTGPRTGLYDMRVNDDISVFVGCGLGGTSLLNANVALPADRRVFKLPEWPEQFRTDPDNVLSDGYARALEMLKPTAYPDETRPTEFPPLAKLNALKKSAEQMHEPFYRPPINVNFGPLINNLNHVGVEQHPCVGCGDCMTGCNYRAKNTVIMNYLPDAKNHGAEIFTQVSVRYLSRRDNRWLVHYQLLNTGRDKFDAPTMFVGADIVVLAAGSLGSTEILLRSKNNGLLSLSNQVGEHFTGNGDFLGFAYNCDEEINGVGFGHRPPVDNGKVRKKVGPCITGIIDLRYKEPVEDGYVIEEGSIAGAFGGLLPGLLSAASAFLGKDTDGGVGDKIKERARELESLVRGPYYGAVRNTQTFLTMAHDDNKGQLKLEDDRLRIHWPDVGNQPIFREVEKKQQEATAALGGTYLKNPVANKITGEDLVTVHPLGGCVMADSADKGAVNHKGQVFSGTQGTDVYDSLYVSDGSVIPRPLGVNPLLTISAVAERACVLMAQDRGWTFDYALPSAPQEAPAPLKLGVRFSESMSGYFSPAVTDEAEDAYRRGVDQGRADGSPFQFIVTIISDDLDRTIADVNYVSPMLGTATAPALSTQALTITEGQFNYFLVDRDRVETKRMQYKMKLSSVEGKTYYFYGFKVIHDDPGIDSWSDTTTLYITLYEGENDQGRVLGKGILRIPISSFMRQMTTMQVTNAGSLTQRWQAMLKFGRFFGGQLIDTYGVNMV